MRKTTILIIEDEPSVLATNQAHLERNGYETVCASTLEDARMQLEESTPDLVLLDVMMPDGSGFDFCADLRKKTKAPIIFLSCRDENESIIKGLLQGGDDYITKPYDLDVLSARIGAQLRRSGIMTAGTIELPPLKIDLLAGEALLDGERINLTQKELQLLGCFALFVGRRLSCQEIYRRAWGEDYLSSSKTIAVHIANLRRKLKLDDGSWFELKSTGQEEYIFSKIRY